MDRNTLTAMPATRRAALQRALATLALLALPGVARAAAPTVRPWPAGKAAPGLDLIDLDGKPWRLAALQGRAVMLNFWATWCEPCRAEMPSLELLATRHERDGLVVVTVNYQESATVIKRFLETLPITLPILLDSAGAATQAWTPRVFPTTVLIDRTGQPVHVVVGEFDWTGAEARALVESLLARPKPA